MTDYLDQLAELGSLVEEMRAQMDWSRRELRLLPIPAGIDPATAQQLRVDRARWVAEAEAAKIPPSTDAIEAGFTNDYQHQQWTHLCAVRDSALLVRKVNNSAGEVLDGLGEVLQPETSPAVRAHHPATGDHHSLGLLRLADRCVRAVHRTLVRHHCSPSVSGSARVAAAGCPGSEAGPSATGGAA